MCLRTYSISVSDCEPCLGDPASRYLSIVAYLLTFTSKIMRTDELVMKRLNGLLYLLRSTGHITIAKEDSIIFHSNIVSKLAANRWNGIIYRDGCLLSMNSHSSGESVSSNPVVFGSAWYAHAAVGLLVQRFLPCNPLLTTSSPSLPNRTQISCPRSPILNQSTGLSHRNNQLLEWGG